VKNRFSWMLALAASLFVALAPVAHAATTTSVVTVSGTVFLEGPEDTIRRPTAGIPVASNDGNAAHNRSAVSDKDGNYTLTGVTRTVLDDGQVLSVTITASKAGLVPGTQTIKPNATANGAIFLVMSDNQAPSVPVVTATKINPTHSSLRFSWPASQDGSGVKEYLYALRKITNPVTAWPADTSNGTALTKTYSGLDADTAYEFRVRARGREGLLSNYGSRTVRTDHDVTVTVSVDPLNSGMTSGMPTLSAAISGDTNMKLQFTVSGEDPQVFIPMTGLTSGSHPHPDAWNTLARPNGTYNVRATVTDSGGNTASDVIQVKVENPNTAWIDGYVYYQLPNNGGWAKLANATVAIWRTGGQPQWLTTGANGYYRFNNLMAGKWNVAVASDDYQGSQITKQMTSGQRTTANFQLLPYRTPVLSPIGGMTSPTVDPNTNKRAYNSYAGSEVPILRFACYDVVHKYFILGGQFGAWSFDPLTGAVLPQWWNLESAMPTDAVPDYSKANQPALFAAHGQSPGARFPWAGAPTWATGADLVCWDMYGIQDTAFGKATVLVAGQTSVVSLQNNVIVDVYQIPVAPGMLSTEVVSVTASQTSVYMLLVSEPLDGSAKVWTIERHKRNDLDSIVSSKTLNFVPGRIRHLDGLGHLAVTDNAGNFHLVRSNDLTEVGMVTQWDSPQANDNTRYLIYGIATSYEHGRIVVLMRRESDGKALVQRYGVN
jgi:hypothetical protein